MRHATFPVMDMIVQCMLAYAHSYGCGQAGRLEMTSCGVGLSCSSRISVVVRCPR